MDLNIILTKHNKWLNNEPDGERANLKGANLTGANLMGANLKGTNLGNISLNDVNFNNSKGIGQFKIIPPEGIIIGWKKSEEGNLIKLVVPKSAMRVNSIGSRKCRANKVKILGFYDCKGIPLSKKVKEQSSLYNNKFKYKIGEEIVVNNFDPSDRIECSYGIHFFITQEEAIEYNV